MDDVGRFVPLFAPGDDAAVAVGHDSLEGCLPGVGVDVLDAGPSIVSSEIEEPFPQRQAWLAPEIPLTRRDEAGEDHHKIGREMVRLQSVEVEECTEEGARGEAESTRKVRGEDDSLNLARSRHHLASGLAPEDAFRHLAGLDEGLNLPGVDGGALPPSPACSGF